MVSVNPGALATPVHTIGASLRVTVDVSGGWPFTRMVIFAPTANGDVTDQWALNADADQGAQTVTLRGTGAGGPGGTDAGTGSDAGTGGGTPPSSDGGCTAAAGPVLWPLLLLVGWLLRPRSSAR